MNADPSPCPRSIPGAKRPLEAVSTAKRLRLKLPRLKRGPLLPIATGVSSSEFDADLEEESSSSCLRSEVSFGSGLGFAGSEVTQRPIRPSRAPKRKRPLPEQSSSDEFRRITRSYTKKQQLLRSAQEKSKQQQPWPEISEGNAASEFQISDVSEATGGLPFENLNENVVSSYAIEKLPEISESSCLESVSDAKSTKIANSAADQGSSLQIAGDLVALSEAAYDVDLDSDLACSEQLSDADNECSEYSTCNETTFSEVESELFYQCSQRDSSECSLSVLVQSPEDFSERSSESIPSVAFSLFLQLTKQFVKSSNSPDPREKQEMMENDSSQEFTVMKFEDEEDEETYESIRSRERREVVLFDFSEEYSSATDYGDFILQQRLVMVNWMVEHLQAMELHHETLFLGASLMDRFLSRGYFYSERNLQLLGIASITLATRLEEVQPGNSIRRRSFTVGSNVYTRSEVVAMEWLLLEVLNFQCMLPTTHNFLWFYLKAAKVDAEVESLSRYLAVLSLLDHERLCFRPSTVAAGLVILACLATNRDASCLRIMETHVRTRTDDLPECIQVCIWTITGQMYDIIPSKGSPRLYYFVGNLGIPVQVCVCIFPIHSISFAGLYLDNVRANV